jgi:hypothetical protein
LADGLTSFTPRHEALLNLITTFLILLLLNGIPVMACLLLGAIQWASTLALVATLVSALITLAAEGIQRGFGLPLHWMTTSIDVRTLIALALEILFLFIVNRRRMQSVRGRPFWLVALHDKLHG